MAIWNALRIYGIFYNHLVNFLPFGTFFPVLVSCTKKNLANLVETGELFHLLNATLSDVHAYLTHTVLQPKISKLQQQSCNFSTY
jgi:hypothetical protein